MCHVFPQLLSKTLFGVSCTYAILYQAMSFSFGESFEPLSALPFTNACDGWVNMVSCRKHGMDFAPADGHHRLLTCKCSKQFTFDLRSRLINERSSIHKDNKSSKQVYAVLLVNYSEPNKVSLTSDYISPREVPQSTSFPFAREFAAKPHQLGCTSVPLKSHKKQTCRKPRTSLQKMPLLTEFVQLISINIH